MESHHGGAPPIGDAAWLAEFAKYQQTPKFRAVNVDMTLGGYQSLFYIEWTHRLIARIAGLAVVLPLALFLWRGIIPVRRSALFVGIALLVGLQGFLGWFMLSSGLLDRPSVSHHRLTLHLLTAMLLLSTATWAAMNRHAGNGPAVRILGSTRVSRCALFLMAVVTLQITYGGLVAGLKAGHVSYSWPPRMGGSLLPAGLFGGADAWWQAITANPAAVHCIHRWFAFVVLAAAVALLARARHATVTAAARRTIHLVAALVSLQIARGSACSGGTCPSRWPCPTRPSASASSPPP